MSKKKIIAGFADNQKYGLGSNTLTAGQKSAIIFGGLSRLFFALCYRVMRLIDSLPSYHIV
eukprot:FN605719.1.p2 GENE.FN605719.1~~FN605719.1.p2  ORF type:complete len:61 (+),score=1.41 FN605719.1:123-305(+)